ncbi:small ribosomal subunit protein uS5m [Planococcus citri]|uniref:small ribosomal subunit protein uS5m n=1 Tax=Planococcus citri TaxID=170843 RepID=UPI0031F99DC7
MYSLLTRFNRVITKTTVTSTNVFRCISYKNDLNNELTLMCNSMKALTVSNGHTSVSYQQKRYSVSGFFNKHPASEIWKSVSSVSNAGRKRGRGKIRGKKVIRDLNRGQVIGIGTANIRWPGLSAPIIRGRELVQQTRLPEDKSIQENLYKLRDSVKRARRQRVAPIDRGWSGGHPNGKRIGPPDPIGDLTFSGFDTVILEQKTVARMTRLFGRLRRVSALCVTGNKNGLVGYALATAPEMKPALKRAKNRAGQRLVYVQRYDEHTVMHDFFTRFANTKIYVWKKPKGYGLRCHRAIRAICEMVGITDLYAKCEGGDAYLNITQAFLLGLLRQKSYKELSEETGMHVVEMSPYHDYFPKVLSSPKDPVYSAEEIPNFNLYVYDNKVFHFKKKYPPFWHKDVRYPIIVRKAENKRSHFDTKIMLRAEYDNELRSFLTDEHPECKPFLPPWTKSIKEAAKAAEEDKAEE